MAAAEPAVYSYMCAPPPSHTPLPTSPHTPVAYLNHAHTQHCLPLPIALATPSPFTFTDNSSRPIMPPIPPPPGTTRNRGKRCSPAASDVIPRTVVGVPQRVGCAAVVPTAENGLPLGLTGVNARADTCTHILTCLPIQIPMTTPEHFTSTMPGNGCMHTPPPDLHTAFPLFLTVPTTPTCNTKQTDPTAIGHTNVHTDPLS